MRSRELDLPPYAGACSCVERGLVGIGDSLDPAPESLEEAVEITYATRGSKPGRMLERFGRLPEGSFVWTRTGEDLFHLGRIAGPWRWDESDAARGTGIHHVRPAHWCDRDLPAAEVPTAVRATFARGGRNLQRTRDEEAERRTAEIWQELTALRSEVERAQQN